MNTLLQLLICLAFLMPGTQSSRSGITNPIILSSSNFVLRFLENDVLQIDVTVFQKSFRLEMTKSKVFYVEDLEVDQFDYFDGSAFMREVKVGTAFGEYRSENNVFVGEFQDENSVYYIDEDSNGNFLYKLSDQPNIHTSMSDMSMHTPVELSLPLPFLTSHPNDESSSAFNDGHICNMNVVVDNTLAKAMNYDITSITSSVKRLIQATNVIFKENDIKVKNNHLHFFIENLVIADQLICSSSPSSVFYCSNSAIDAKSYLTKQAMDETSGRYCLSYALTNRQFGGTQGATFSGGICSEYNRDSKQGFNTGFLVIENPQMGLFPSDFTLAHLISHSLGVDHDDFRCGSGFLMDSNSPIFKTRKTRMFSTCTKEKMTSALKEMETTHFRQDCFRDEFYQSQIPIETTPETEIVDIYPPPQSEIVDIYPPPQSETEETEIDTTLQSEIEETEIDTTLQSVTPIFTTTTTTKQPVIPIFTINEQPATSRTTFIDTTPITVSLSTTTERIENLPTPAQIGSSGPKTSVPIGYKIWIFVLLLLQNNWF